MINIGDQTSRQLYTAGKTCTHGHQNKKKKIPAIPGYKNS